MIKFIYFDVGGVLIRDFSCTDKWELVKSDLGVKPSQSKAFDKFFDKAEEDVDRGQDLQTLLPIMEKKFGLGFFPGYSLQKDIGFRFERNENIWPLAREAKKKYKVGLLTNMYPGFLDLLYSSGLMEDVGWDAVIDSSLEGTRKPESRIFEIARERAGVAPKEIFFIENTKGHIAAAKALGWQTFHFDSKDYEGSTRKLKNEILKT